MRDLTAERLSCARESCEAQPAGQGGSPTAPMPAKRPVIAESRDRYEIEVGGACPAASAAGSGGTLRDV
jgi:hypothetical protein